MLTYFKNELAQRWLVSRQAGETNYYWDGVEQFERLPKWHGQGQSQLLWFSNGIWVEISQKAYAMPFRYIHCHDSQFPLTGKFYLSGQVHVTTSGIAHEYVEAEGQNYLYCLPDAEEVEVYQSDKSTDTVMIWVTPDYLRTFMGERLEGLMPELQQFAQGRSRPFFHRSLGKNTAAMQVALHQMIHCPYHGLVRHMFLESRATELLALQFAQWSLIESSNSQSLKPLDCALRPSDVDAIYLAQEILQQRMEHPPSLLELARLVGLNDRKLKQGFRQVFGTTVFGYLHQYRLEQARQLLSTDTMSVAEVAYAIGFSNRSYFAIVFRRKFGVNPSQFLAESRRHRQVF
jgi:AraC family transcriptional regulator, transcriptional activator of the genes for pyochelin and ferripyochelin receptors